MAAEVPHLMAAEVIHLMAAEVIQQAGYQTNRANNHLHVQDKQSKKISIINYKGKLGQNFWRDDDEILKFTKYIQTIKNGSRGWRFFTVNSIVIYKAFIMT